MYLVKKPEHHVCRECGRLFQHYAWAPNRFCSQSCVRRYMQLLFKLSADMEQNLGLPQKEVLRIACAPLRRKITTSL